MEILYKQSNDKHSTRLCDYGIERCYLKHLSYRADRVSVTRKGHHHTGFEIHIIERGYQEYEIGGKTVTVNASEILVLSPLITHIAKDEDDETEKYAITFSTVEGSHLARACESIDGYFLARIPDAVRESIKTIERERRDVKPYSDAIIEGRALECVLRILQLIGIGESESRPVRDEDTRLLLAKQYVRDNVLRPVTLSEVASYCCISEKQLTRIFKKSDGVTVTEYIRKERCLHIEKLLAERNLSLREISDMMNFSSEYYFNAVFKKLSGMTPGAYRKCILETTAK